MTRTTLELHLMTSDAGVSLERTLFTSALSSAPVTAIRGTTFLNAIPVFRWTVTTHALTVFLLKAALLGMSGKPLTAPVLSGEIRSLAASLSFALPKHTFSAKDILGFDAQARPLMSRAIRVVNQNLYRPGPVYLCLNENVLPASSIKVFLDGHEIKKQQLLEKLTQKLEDAWKPQLSNVRTKIGLSTNAIENFSQAA